MNRETTSARTPPEIVQASDDPRSALAAFIGQELEHWKFNVRPGTQPGTLRVYPPGRELGTHLIVRVGYRDA